MINNRQNGRRRGRGGPQARNGAGNGPERGNRIDSRARGNAAQLHEKYRNLARDAQTQGDRVMTEYYLQFADHYFRVLGESRARFEEQNQYRRARDDADYDGDEADGDGEDGFEIERQPRQRDYRESRERDPREGRDRDNRDQRDGREQRDTRQPVEARQPEQRPSEQRQPDQRQPEQRAPEPRAVAEPVSDGSEAAPQGGDEGEARRPRRGRRRRTEGETVEAAAEGEARIEGDRLPPAFAPEPELALDGRAETTNGAHADAAVEPAAEAPKRRRTRRVKEEGESGTVAAV